MFACVVKLSGNLLPASLVDDMSESAYAHDRAVRLCKAHRTGTKALASRGVEVTEPEALWTALKRPPVRSCTADSGHKIARIAT